MCAIGPPARLTSLGHISQSPEFHLDQPFSSVNQCQIVVICVVPPETEKCAKQLAKTLKKNENTGIFTFQQGCKNYSSIEPWSDSIADDRARPTSLYVGTGP